MSSELWRNPDLTIFVHLNIDTILGQASDPVLFFFYHEASLHNPPLASSICAIFVGRPPPVSAFSCS